MHSLMYLSLCFYRLSSPHNEAVTSYLVEALAASPGLQSEDNDVLLCKCSGLELVLE